jgi:hypothetical protein
VAISPSSSQDERGKAKAVVRGFNAVPNIPPRSLLGNCDDSFCYPAGKDGAVCSALSAVQKVQCKNSKNLWQPEELGLQKVAYDFVSYAAFCSRARAMYFRSGNATKLKKVFLE